MLAAIGMPKRAAVLLLLVTSAVGAPGDSSSDDSTNVYCDECGASATYAETIDTSGTYAKRNVVTNGCPNHYNLCTGKDGTDGCGAVGEEGDGTQATEQDHDFDIPLYPILATSTTDWPGCVTYEIGVALNGVPIYGGAVSDDCGWSYGGDCSACIRAGQESEIPNFKGSFLGRFPLVSADFWTSDHLSERSRSVDDFSGTRARGTLTLKRR